MFSGAMLRPGTIDTPRLFYERPTIQLESHVLSLLKHHVHSFPYQLFAFKYRPQDMSTL